MRNYLYLALLLFLFSCGHEATEIATERITTNLQRSPKGLNPLLYNGASDQTVNALIFSTLCDYNPATLAYEPLLIKEVPKAIPSPSSAYPNAIRYEVELLDNITWDDGSAMTGEDILLTMKLIFHPSSNAIKYRSYMQNVYDVLIDEQNPNKVSFFFTDNSISSMELVTHFPILNKGFYDSQGVLDGVQLSELMDNEAYAQREDKPALDKFAERFNSSTFSVDSVSGSGPYRLKEWLTDQYIVLEKKENYWGANSSNPMLQAYPNEIQFIITVDKAAAFTQLKAGVYDIYNGLNINQYEEIKENETYSAEYNLQSVQLQTFYFMVLNSRKKALADLSVRKALAYLMDVDTIISSYEKGMAERINSPFLTVDDKSTLEDIKYDAEKASSLLAEAQWTDSNGNGTLDKVIDGKLVELQLSCISTGSQLGQIITGTLRQNAKELGIDIIIETLDRTLYQKRLKTNDFDITVSGKGLSLAPYDPYAMFHTNNRDAGESNVGNFGNAVSDSLINEIRLTTDPQKRDDSYLELEKLIYADQPYIFLYSPTNKMAIKKGIDGITSIKSPGFAIQTFRKTQEEK